MLHERAIIADRRTFGSLSFLLLLDPACLFFCPPIDFSFLTFSEVSTGRKNRGPKQTSSGQLYDFVFYSWLYADVRHFAGRERMFSDSGTKRSKGGKKKVGRPVEGGRIGARRGSKTPKRILQVLFYGELQITNLWIFYTTRVKAGNIRKLFIVFTLRCCRERKERFLRPEKRGISRQKFINRSSFLTLFSYRAIENLLYSTLNYLSSLFVCMKKPLQ